ncbi:MAG: hypothetical protein C4338_06205 [Rhodanobacteraceae bacterium]
MKRLSFLLTVLCTSGLPLTAAAFDYGTDQRFLAAETPAPVLPSARSEGNPYGDMASHRSHADDDDASPVAASPEEARPAPSRTPGARRIPTSPAAVPGVGAAPPPQHTHGILSWQSLLPGSIQ